MPNLGSREGKHCLGELGPRVDDFDVRARTLGATAAGVLSLEVKVCEWNCSKKIKGACILQ